MHILQEARSQTGRLQITHQRQRTMHRQQQKNLLPKQGQQNHGQRNHQWHHAFGFLVKDSVTPQT